MTGCDVDATHPTCPVCDLGLHHCHAPILEHDDGTYECLDGCGGPRAIHDLVLADDGLANDVLADDVERPAPALAAPRAA